MKKFKKNFSKTVFASFFVFQFIVSTSFAPMMVNAQEIEAKSSEESVQKEVKTSVKDIKDNKTKEEDSVKDNNIKQVGNTAVQIIKDIVGVTGSDSVEDNSTKESAAEEVAIQEAKEEATFNVASEVSTPLAAGGNSGSVKTTNESCSDTNINQYEVGEILWIYASGFDSNTEYNWSISRVNNSSEIIGMGSATTDENGDICLNTSIQFNLSNTGNPGYKLDFGNKTDNFSVVTAPVNSVFNGDLKVCKVIVNTNGNFVDVSNWSSFGNENFSINFTLRNQSLDFSFNTAQDNTITEFNGFQAVCDEKGIEVLGDLEVSYSEENSSDNWEENYFWGNPEAGLLNQDGSPRFSAYEDGKLWITTDTNTDRFNPTLFLVNKQIKEIKPADTTKIYATKIVCDKEELLPNWGDKPSRVEDIIITSNTASEFLADKGDNCWIDQDWNFQYKLAYDPIADEYTNVSPGDNLGEVSGWTTFNGTEELNGNNIKVATIVADGNSVWVREVMKPGYLEFSGDLIDNAGDAHSNVSAEMYCHNDVWNYDNFDLVVDPYSNEGPYHCISFNVKLAEEPNFCPAGTTLKERDVVTVYPANPAGNGPRTSNSITLPAGDYLLEASGTYIYRNYQGQGQEFLEADAAFSHRASTDSFPGLDYSVNQWAQTPSGGLGIRVNGQSPSAVWGTTYNPLHKYSYEAENFAGGEFNFTITDNIYRDNTGFLTVKIYDCNDGGTDPVDPTYCEAFARIFVTEYSNKRGEVETSGNVSSNSFLSSASTTAIASGHSFRIDGFNETLVEDVPGIAVERTNGKIRMGIYGSHPATDREYVKGYVLLTNASVTSVYSDESGNNRLETLLNTPNGTPDTLILTSPTRVDFTLQVNTNDDFFYVDYIVLEGDCEEDPTDLGCTENCGGPGDGGNGNDGNNGGSSGGGSSGGSSGGRVAGASDEGEILGATSCMAFTTYNNTGSNGGEVKALQTFLNMYMNAGLTVDGVYGRTTTQAVHDFQAFHWNEVIDPWTPPLSPNTTGWQYKTTRMTINAIIDCPEAPVYLEDPATIYQVLEVVDDKGLSQEQIEVVYNLLAEAQGVNVLGASDASYDISDKTNPNYYVEYGGR